MEEIVDTVCFEKYPAYKYTSVEPLGEIPAHWDVIKAKYLWKEIVDLSNNENETLLSVSQYTGVGISSDRSRGESMVGLKKVKKNDLVINIMLAWLGGLGLSSFEGIVSTAYAVYRLTKEANQKYLHYLYRTNVYLDEFATRSKGIVPSRWRMYTEDFGQVLTLYPPLTEQTAIANFLDTKTAQIDLIIAQKEKQVELLKERRQILIRKAVTQGVNPDAPMKYCGVEWIGEIPAHWTVTSVRKFMDVRDGTHDTPIYLDYNKNTFPLVTSKDFDEDVINFENTKMISKRDHLEISKRSRVEKSDVLMSMIGGNIGKSVIVESEEFSVKNVAIFKTNKDRCLAKYLRYYFESGILKTQIDLKSRGGAQGFLALGDIRNLIFFKISNNELKEIVAYIDDNISNKTANAISCKQKEIEKLKEYKATLINSAVTGKIKVS